MKKMILLTLLLSLLSCNPKENKIEIVPDYDSIYLTENDVDSPAKEKSQYYSEKFNKDMNDLFISNYDKSLNKPVVFKIAFRVYINENGMIDKLKILNAESFDLKIDKGIGVEFTDYSKLYSKLPALLEKFSFLPAMKNGNSVKFRNDIVYGCLVYPNGTVKGFLPLNISWNSSSFNTEDYLLNVENSPGPVGGIVTLMKNVRYPQTAKDKKIQGKVILKAFIDEKGSVVKTEILKGTGTELDTAAVNAVVQTKFFPGKQAGIPVKTQIAIPIVFKLK